MAFIEGKPQPNFASTLGEQLHKALGQVGQIKLQQMMQRQEQARQAQTYAQLPGVKPEWAQAISQIPEKGRMDVLRELMAQQQPGQSTSGFQGSLGNTQVMQPTTDQGPQAYMPARVPYESPRMRYQREKEGRHTYEHAADMEAQQYARNTTRYKNYVEDLDKSRKNALKIKQIARRAKELINKGKTRSGMAGYLTGAWSLSSADTRELATKYQELAGLKALEATGPMSKARLQQAQAQKVSMDMPKSAQLNLLNEYIKDSEMAIEPHNIYNEIMSANKNKTPEGLDVLIDKEFQARHPELFNEETNVQPMVAQTANPAKQQAQLSSGQSANQPYNADEENLLQSVLRTGIGGAARVAGGAVSGLGNLTQLGAGAAGYVAGISGYNPKISEAVEKYSPLPTSAGIEQALSKATRGYTDPQGGGERFMYDILDTFGSIVSPASVVGGLTSGLTKVGMGATKAAKAANILLPFSGYTGSATKALAASAAGHGAKQLTAELGGGNLAQLTAQTAAMLATGTAGTRKAMGEEAGALFNNAKEGFADTFQDATPIMKNLLDIKHKAIRQGHPYSKQVGDIVDELVVGINKNRFQHPVTDLIAGSKNINSRYSWSTQERIPGGKFTPKEIRPELGEIVKVLDKGVARAGMMNPSAEESAKNYFMAKDLWKGLNIHSDVGQFFKSNADINESFAHNHSWSGSLFNLVKTGIGKVGHNMANVKTLLSSKVGKEHYLAALKAAANNNRNAFVHQMNELNKVARKEGIE